MTLPIDPGPLWLSLRVASLATVAVLVVGTPAAYVLARREFRGKGLLAGLLVLPLVLPPTVLGYGLLQVFGRRAVLGMWLEATFGVVLVFHWSGAVLASSVAAFPLFLLPARAGFESVDPALEDVARLLGRSDMSVFFSVTLPLARQGLVAGALLAFVRAVGDFGATLMVAGDLPGRTRTASLAIYDAVMRDDSRTAGTYTALVSVVSVLVLWAVQRRRRPGR